MKQVQQFLVTEQDDKGTTEKTKCRIAKNRFIRRTDRMRDSTK